MALTKEQAVESNVSVDRPELLQFIKDGIAGMLREVAGKNFKLPMRFRMTDVHGDLLRAFTIHKDGIKLEPPTGNSNKLYVFPLTATVRSVDGRTARMRLTAVAADPVEFLN